MRNLAIVLLLAGAAAADERDLERPPVSGKAKQLREQAKALWDGVQPVFEKVRLNKEVTPDEAAGAVPALEQAAELYERSLREEWNGEANRILANVARAWWKLHPLVPRPGTPADEAQRKKMERAADAERLARTREIRDFVMKYGRERRVDSLLRLCTKCEGRKEIRSPFGERAPCAACSKRGRLVDREAVIAARWNRFSPLYRAETRHEQEVNRLLRSFAPDEQRDAFAPYISSVLIKDVEDHDLWALVKAQDTVQPSALSQKTEKADSTYVLFRVGRVWYLYDLRSDRELIDLTETLEPPAPPK